MPKQIIIDYEEYLSMVSIIDKLKNSEVIKNIQQILQSQYNECKIRSQDKSITQNDALLCKAMSLIIKKLSESLNITIEDI